MKEWIISAAIVATTVLPKQSEAQGIVQTSATTAEIARACDEEPNPLHEGFCSGYLMASFDALAMNDIICPSRGTSTYQALAVGRKYLSDHPELWSKSPSWVLRQAYKTAFPCSR